MLTYDITNVTGWRIGGDSSAYRRESKSYQVYSSSASMLFVLVGRKGAAYAGEYLEFGRIIRQTGTAPSPDVPKDGSGKVSFRAKWHFAESKKKVFEEKVVSVSVRPCGRAQMSTHSCVHLDVTAP